LNKKLRKAEELKRKEEEEADFYKFLKNLNEVPFEAPKENK
jgi:hypothetical protein